MAENRQDGELVLGFDPGSQVTGWGLIASPRWLLAHSEGRRPVRKPAMLACGALRPKRGDPLEQRLLTLFDGAAELIAQHQPTIVAVENPFVGKSAKAALALGQARGALLLAAGRAGLPVASYEPRLVKSSVVGNGGASKEQVQFMVQSLLGLKEAPTPLDTSDALAVALCHLNRRKLQMLGR